METIAVVIAIIAFVYFLLKFPPFRIVTMFLIGFAVLIGLLTWAYTVFDDYRNTWKLEKAKSLIHMGDLDLSEFSLQKSSPSIYFDFSGVVKNNSKYPISEITFLITIEKCVEVDSNCTIVGQETSSTSIEIPSKQARKVSKGIAFSDLPNLQNWRWSFVVSSVTADTRNMN